MWIQVRTIDGKKTARVDSLSKLTKIEDLRKRLVDLFDAEVGDQRLFFRGKQLEDGYSLFDYDVGLNDLIQLMIRVKPAPSTESANPSTSSKPDPVCGAEENVSDKENKEPDSDGEESRSSSNIVCLDTEEGNIYKLGDVIDARDPGMGAWFEAKIVEVLKDKSQHQRPLSRSSSSSSISRNHNSVPATSTSSSSTSHNSSPHVVNETGDTPNKVRKNAKRSEKIPKDINFNEDSKYPSKSEPGVEPMVTDNALDETDGSVATTVKKEEEESKVLTPKKISSSKKNVAGASSSPASRNLFKQDVSEGLKKQGILSETTVSDGYIYKIAFEGYEDDVIELNSKNIRPRARHLIPVERLKEGQTIMANFNYDDQQSRGFWYDCHVTSKKVTRTQKEVYATVLLGADLTPLENCRLLFLDELFEVEKPGTQLTEQDILLNPTASPAKRQNKPDCDFCKDNPRRKCKHCACCVCGGKHDPDRQLMCDDCDKAYHLDCLSPPLEAIPDVDDWYCPECKRDENEVVKAGEKLKESKKKSKMASATSSTTRDWGKGMACVGRTKMCTIVPSNHYGPIPGVEVGSLWLYRVQVSEAGVHRPHVAGIHGREDDGAFSIVLSGGYEDDADNGDEFYYTGSGGRDLSGNKRTAEQSCDQKLTRMNKALAKNCNVAINSKTGAEAKDWKGGKPVRVVRNSKGRKHSKYAPEEGNRYDGVYKIVKYWAEKGKSGFLVWRYLLRRDDPSPAPWTKAGAKRCEELGLTMQYPPGYLEQLEEKERKKAAAANEASGESDTSEEASPKKRGRKRKAEASPAEKEVTKKSKAANFKVDPKILKLIKEDQANQKLWDAALAHVKEGRQTFVQQLEEVFMCICCQEILCKPVTLQCSHNFCKPCIKRSFKADVYSCPACREDVAKDSKLPVNTTLATVLNHFFPGYEVGRE